MELHPQHQAISLSTDPGFHRMDSATTEDAPARTQDLLAEVTSSVDSSLILWRSEDLTGRDIDLLVADTAYSRVAEFLGARGFVPTVGDPGHVVWSPPTTDDAGPVLDFVLFSAWPAYYPRLQGIVARAERSTLGPLISSPADRMLTFAAEAVLGRPLAKVERRLAQLARTTDAAAGLDAVAATVGADRLAGLAREPERLAAMARRRGFLSYPYAAVLAAQSPLARSALLARLRNRVRRFTGGKLRSPGLRPASGGPLLVTISGLDGAGKSTAVEVVRDHLADLGLPATTVWGRLGAETELLKRFGGPIKRILGRSGTIADPVAAGGPSVDKRQDPREAQRRTLVSWCWIVIVALINARSYRGAAAARRGGCHVICDRWTTDALVDLELRYGPHRVAHTILRLLSPRRQLGILLRIDAETAQRRKPDDQAPPMLTLMEPLYEQRARSEHLVILDATLPESELHQRLRAIVDATLLVDGSVSSGHQAASRS